MPTDWISSSEVVAGAAYKHKFAPKDKENLKISPLMLRPELFYPPYDEFISDLLAENATPEDIVSSHTNTYQATKHAVESLNGAGHDVDWVIILEKSAAEYKAAEQFERVAKKLKAGNDVDWSKIHSIVAGAQLLENVDAFQTLDSIDRTAIPFIPTGYLPFDEHLLGLPEVGMILLFGPRKSGKTTFALQLAGSFAKTHKKKTVAIFSLEMLAPYLATRMDQVMKLTPKEQKRFVIRDLMDTPEEVVNRAATIENLGLVVVDFADLMIRGETTESSMGHVYRTMSIGAKQLRVPIIVLAHPNKQYQGGIPRPEQVRWTGLASNLSEMILAIYNPRQNVSFMYDKDDDKILRPVQDMAYVIAWEIRGGFRLHEKDNPGAIRIPFAPKKGWHPKKSNWFWIRD